MRSVSLALPLAVVTLLAVLTAPTPALATDTAPAATTTIEPDGYGYKFKDDLLGVGFINATDARLHVVTHAARNLLIRPRTQFVSELLKSVENL